MGVFDIRGKGSLMIMIRWKNAFENNKKGKHWPATNMFFWCYNLKSGENDKNASTAKIRSIVYLGFLN